MVRFHYQPSIDFVKWLLFLRLKTKMQEIWCQNILLQSLLVCIKTTCHYLVLWVFWSSSTWIISWWISAKFDDFRHYFLITSFNLNFISTGTLFIIKPSSCLIKVISPSFSYFTMNSFSLISLLSYSIISLSRFLKIICNRHLF